MTLRKITDNARQVCVFGVGALLNECYDQLAFFLGRDPDFFCDNAPGKWGTTFRGRKCISPEQLARITDGTVVIVAVRQYEEISRQLSAMGISDVLICSFDRGYYQLRGIRRHELDQEASSGQKPAALQLAGKWTLVTGASRGVGRQIAMAMARLGANVVAHSRSVSHVQEVLEACTAWGGRIIPVAAELSSPEELEAMLARLDQIAPHIDIVFNNAAIAPYNPSGFWGMSTDIYRSCYAVNTIAPVRICQHLVAKMIQRGFGRVVNVSTNLRGQPAEMAYSISKAALDKFVDDLVPSLHGTGVMMTLADPGWVRTDAGGPEASHPVETVIPGILLGAVLDGDINGCRFSAQEYAGLSIEAACIKAKQNLERHRCKWV